MAILGELVVCMFVCCQGMPDGAVVYESALVYMYIRSGSNEQFTKHATAIVTGDSP